MIFKETTGCYLFILKNISLKLQNNHIESSMNPPNIKKFKKSSLLDNLFNTYTVSTS